MTVPKNIGMILLAVYLIVVGLSGLFHFSLGDLSFLVPLCALLAGILILLGK